MHENVLTQQPYCFVESFDSVRYAQSIPESLGSEELQTQDNAIKTIKIQAEIELIYSLLLGNKIIVPEPHSFDSIGFLEIVTDALNSEVYKIESQKREWIRLPFFLSLRKGSESYLQMISNSFKRQGFILSSMSDINDNLSLRTEIATFLEEGKFEKIENKLANTNNDVCIEKINKIRILSEYFGLESCKKAKTNPELLERYVRNLIDRDKFSDALMQNPGFKALREGLKTLKEANIKFLDRGTVRREGRSYLDPDTYTGIVEYVDSCYNAVIYNAIEAQTGILTTTETTKGRYVILAQELSEASAGFSDKDRIKLWINSREAVEIKDSIESWINDREDRWNHIWEIMLNDQWVESVNRLILASRETLRDAYRSHVRTLQYLTRDLGDIKFKGSEENTQSVQVTNNKQPIADLKREIDESEEKSLLEDSDYSTFIYGSTPGSDV